jgi:hypothetical protein
LIGTLLPRANTAACPQLAKADFASSSQHVREGQRIAELEAEIDVLRQIGRQVGDGTSASGGLAEWSKRRNNHLSAQTGHKL